MKHFLTLLLLITGFYFSGTLHAQTTPPSRSTSADTAATKKAEQAKPSQGSSNEITIDENGTPRPKHKKQNAKKADNAPKAEAPKEKATSKDSPSPASAPSEIAIDESGTSRPKAKPKPGNATPTVEQPKNDSTILAPAGQVGRPE